MKKLILILLIFLSLNLQAQEPTLPGAENTKVEMADTMRQEGKIYVVVAVVVAILSGLLIYTVVIDRKVARLEKKLEE
ncbi:MAG: CcmD family protein [Cyclobacteriaceae bacterium]